MLERTDGNLIHLVNERQTMALVEQTEFINTVYIRNLNNLQ